MYTPCLTLTSRTFSAWTHIMGERRTWVGKKRQVDEVSIYTNKRVLKKFKAEHHAEYMQSMRVP